MRAYILISLLLNFAAGSKSKAQDINIDTSLQFSVISLPSYYNEKGIVFSKDYVVGIEIRNLKFRYTPTKNDIIKAENIFIDKYNEIRKVNVDVKTYFCHWVRQYIGLVDASGNENIIVQLIDNTKPRKINRLLGKDWETVFVTMLSDNFYSVSTRVRINLNTGEMSEKL
jgi:hypothetical protein